MNIAGKLDVEPRHFEIIKNILQKYSYSFYAFGSRAKGNAKKFSDLDLCYFDRIYARDILKIEEDFEESDLPYKVDLVDWQNCDQDFQNIIFNDMICIQVSDLLMRVEKNIYRHFKYLPELAGLSIKKYDSITIINCMLKSSMFNVVYGAPDSKNSDNDQKIIDVKNQFCEQDFAWWIGPSAQSIIFKQKLLAHGFIVETNEYVMLCDLDAFNVQDFSSSQLYIEQVSNKKQCDDFANIISIYDSEARVFYDDIALSELQKQEKLFVGYENNIPVVISIAFTQDNTVGIFSLITQEDKRSQGYGTQMMQHIMQIAKQDGVKYAALSASSDTGYRIYARLGFETIGKFECFEWKA